MPADSVKALAVPPAGGQVYLPASDGIPRYRARMRLGAAGSLACSLLVPLALACAESKPCAPPANASVQATPQATPISRDDARGVAVSAAQGEGYSSLQVGEIVLGNGCYWNVKMRALRGDQGGTLLVRVGAYDGSVARMKWSSDAGPWCLQGTSCCRFK